MKRHYQLAVIGAGPAGLAAATVAAEQGIEVAVFDEQRAPGGQIYRAMESIPHYRARQLGSEYQRGRDLVSAFRASGALYFPDTQVWSLNRRRHVVGADVLVRRHHVHRANELGQRAPVGRRRYQGEGEKRKSENRKVPHRSIQRAMI